MKKGVPTVTMVTTVAIIATVETAVTVTSRLVVMETAQTAGQGRPVSHVSIFFSHPYTTYAVVR